MTDVWTRPLLRRDEVRWGSRVPWLAGLLAAGWAMVAGLALAALPGLVVWIGGGAEAPASEPLRLGAVVWLAAHRVGLNVDGTPLLLAPGGLSILIALLLYRAARWAAHVSAVETPTAAVSVVGPAALSYATGAWVLAGVSATDQLAADPLVAAVCAGLAASTAAGFGVIREAGLIRPLAGQLPDWQRAGLLAAAVAVCGLVAVGTVLVAMSSVVHSDRIGALAETLEPDVPGVIVLALATAAIVPNLAIWAAAFALGPGFAVGAETSVAPGGVELGLVPALPALGALPADDLGPVGWLAVLGPILVGCVAGAMIRRRTPAAGLLSVAASAAVAAVAAGLAMALLTWLSSGSVGTDRLTEIGAVPWHAGIATVVFVAVPAMAVALPLRPSVHSG